MEDQLELNIPEEKVGGVSQLSIDVNKIPKINNLSVGKNYFWFTVSVGSDHSLWPCGF